MTLGSTINAIDLFCGFGGSSQGIHRAGGEVRVAANHSKHSVEVHAANFPDTDHVVADFSDPNSEKAPYIDPADLPPARFMWASPSCRFHSPANARKLYARGPTLFDLDADFDHDLYASSERSRVTMVCPLRYAAKHLPEAVVVENVVEAAKWGPDRDGSTFKWWLNEWRKVGYQHQILFLNSMFFPPCPQSRDRMYVVFWRERNRPPDLDYRPLAWCEQCDDLTEAVQVWKPRRSSWPLEQWGKWGGQYIYRCPRHNSELTPIAWPAASAIDWSNLGPLLLDRERPIADNTIKRIRRGLARFSQFPVVITDQGIMSKTVASLAVVAGNTFERPGSNTRTRHPSEVVWTQHATGFVGLAQMPSLVSLRGTEDRQLDGARSVFDPTLTVSAGGGHHGLVVGGWIKQNAGQTTAWHPYSDPFGAITGRDTTGLVCVPWIDSYHHVALTSVMEPVAAALSKLRHSLAIAPAGDPDLVDIEDVRFRMLEPDPELRRVMAFDSDFVLFGPKTRITAGLGNAVTPPVADWICQRVIGSLDQKVAA